MVERTRHEHAAWIGALILGAGVVAEGLRVVLRRPWPGFEPRFVLVVSAVLALTWGCCLVAVLWRRRFRWSATAAWFAVFLGPILMLGHGAITRVGGSVLGLLYVPAALVLVIALKRVFDRGEIARLPDSNPPENSRVHP
jgi:hypothetical protein